MILSEIYIKRGPLFRFLLFGFLLALSITLASLPVLDILSIPKIYKGMSRELNILGLVLSILLILFIGIGVWVNKRWITPLLVFVPVILFARLYYIDLPVLFALIWLEALIGLGLLFNKMTGTSFSSHEVIYSALLGTLVMGVLSVLAYATGLTIWAPWAVVVIACAFSFFQLKGGGLFKAYNAFTVEDRSTKVILSCLAAFFLIVMARGNNSGNHDSLWYSYRPQDVLLVDGDFWAELGLSAFPYYYPKFFEFMTFLVSPLNEFSFYHAINLSFALLLASIVFTSSKNLLPSKPLAALSTAFIFTIPTNASTLVTGEPDFFLMFLLLAAVFLLLDFVKSGSLKIWFLGLALLITGLGVKLLSVPFGGVIGLAYLVIGFKHVRRHSVLHKWQKYSREVWEGVFLISALIVTLLLLSLRTYFLTGLPIIGQSSLVDAFMALGFKPYPYILTSEGFKWMFSLQGMWNTFEDYFFHPSLLKQVWFAWPTSANWMLLLLTIFGGTQVYAAVRRSRRISLLLTIALVIGFLGLMFALTWTNTRGASGTYFGFPVTVLALALIVVGARAYENGKLFLSAVIFPYFLAHFIIVYAVVPGIHTGIGYRDVSFSHSVFDSHVEKNKVLVSYEAHMINREIRTFTDQKEGDCFGWYHLPRSLAFFIDCRLGTLAMLPPYYRNDFSAWLSFAAEKDADILVRWRLSGRTLSDFMNIVRDCPGVLDMSTEHYDAMRIQSWKHIPQCVDGRLTETFVLTEGLQNLRQIINGEFVEMNLRNFRKSSFGGFLGTRIAATNKKISLRAKVSIAQSRKNLFLRMPLSTLRFRSRSDDMACRYVNIRWSGSKGVEERKIDIADESTFLDIPLSDIAKSARDVDITLNPCGNMHFGLPGIWEKKALSLEELKRRRCYIGDYIISFCRERGLF